MAASGTKPGTLPDPAIAVQIDTTLHCSESRYRHGFQQFHPSINRTVVLGSKETQFPFCSLTPQQAAGNALAMHFQ
jgi:hypothetical protein